MMDAEKFHHEVSRYERPGLRYRCGRAAEWGEPCAYGPSAGGECGGTAECRPAKIGDRYECRRPSWAGGTCTEGPRPDGNCAHQKPPCRPRRTLRSVRGLLAVGAFTVAAAVIGVFLTVSDSSGRAVISAGPLTGGHANFTAKTGCVACHKPHNGDLGGWAMAAFHEDDLTDNCLTCHTFGGDARLGHNAPSDISPRGRETSCVECHTEHKGERFDIVTVTDKACNACHKQRVDSFGENHPQFAANFPHDRRTAIVFDHASHMAKHFVDARYKDVAPENCTSCHEMQGAAKQFVRPKNFDETCVTCHADNIVSRDLVLLRLPEFSENLLDKQKVMEACGPTLEQWRTMMEAMSGEAEMDKMQEVMKEEEYEPISSEEASAISAYLLGMAPDDPDDLEMQGFVWRLILEGERPIAELIEARAGRRVSDRLLAGLNQELVRRVACAWASNVEYEPPNDPEFGGWYGDGLELKYRPPHAKGHADPVAYEWAMFAAASAKEDDAALVEFAEAMRAIVLSRSEGVGACVKCHAVSDDGEGGLAIEWRYEESTTRPFTRFNHPMHLTLVNPEGINLMDPDAGCRTCHKTNEGAAYQASFDGTDPHRFESNFASMTKETCTQCHNAGKVRQECKTCHSYHFKPGFDLRMAKDAH